MTNTTNFYSLKNFLIIAIFIQLFRLGVLYFLMKDYGLYIDEVYYWGWAQSFELGYFSKPPMIAWLIMLTTSIFGDGEIATKVGSIFVYPLTSSIIYLIAIRLFNDNKIAFYSALSFLTLPAISMSSIIISTDVVLLLFWSLSIYFFLKAIDEEQRKYWLLAGFFAGCGMLSKYNMVFFLISAILVLILDKNYRKVFKKIDFYISIVVAFIVFIPNLYWQFTHDFISFAHTKEISQVEKDLFHFDKMLEFLGSQLGVFGLVLFPVMLFLLFKFKTIFSDKSLKFLYLFVIPYFLFITTLSLLSRAFANWSAPVYVAGTILVIAFLIKNGKIKLVKISLALNILLALILYFYHPIMNTFGVELTKKNDPYKRISGWEQVAKNLDNIRKKYNYRLIFEDRKIMSEMIFYMKPHPFDSLIYNSEGVVTNHYHMFNNIDNKPLKGKFLYITRTDKPQFKDGEFENVKFIKEIEVKLYDNYSIKCKVYFVENFLTYSTK